MKTLIKIAYVIGWVALSLCYFSCTPTHYVVDTTPYEEQINSNPSEVIIKHEHVKEVGGFQFEGGAIIETDRGRFDISERGVSGKVLIDLREAPRSNSEGGK